MDSNEKPPKNVDGENTSVGDAKIDQGNAESQSSNIAKPDVISSNTSDAASVEKSNSETQSSDKSQADAVNTKAKKEPSKPSAVESSSSVIESEEASTKKKTTAPINHKPARQWLVSLSFAMALIAVSAVTYIYWQGKNYIGAANLQSRTAEQKISQLSAEVIKNQGEISELGSRYTQELAQMSQRLLAAEERLKAQHKRILSMSTTSREDWLLAEAEYLMKLANQRVLIERRAGSAVALLSEADNILRDLGDPDTFALRQALQIDLVALKLVHAIDVDGIYLRLNALALQAESIAILPETFAEAESHANPDPDAEIQVSVSSTSEDVSNSFSRFFNGFRNYFRIIDNTEKPEALLPPEDTAYLQLNLRFQIERAQVALLREQQDVYSSSLKQAEAWVARFYPSSESSRAFRHELAQLSDKTVVQTLPDITGSLELLHGYIGDLHALKGSSQTTRLNEVLEPAPASEEAL